MYYANYHTHTPRCGHATGTEKEMADAALAAGIRILGFADHSPQVLDMEQGNILGMRMKIHEIPGYVEAVRNVADEYSDRLKVLCGFEAEYLPHIFDGLYGICRDFDIDYMIMGQHCLPYPDGLTYEFIAFGHPVHTLRSYVRTVSEGLETGCFSYLAHPDIYHAEGISDEEYDAEMSDLCETARDLDIPLEINLLGYVTKRHYPSERFFRIAGKVGNTLVVGVDAHQPEMFNRDYFESTCEFAKSFGLKVTDEINLLHPWKDK
ncbi:MAG: histidinol-phosphatase [Clostridia bacterium]|nr:histidinol-phosphatase [Clostridia bacterium]